MSQLAERLGFAPKTFYTIGYSGKTIAQFVRALKLRRVATLVDIRDTPVSRHRPEFSKRNLQTALAEQAVDYAHLPNLGVPKDLRDQLRSTGDYESLFRWYDSMVAPRIESELAELLADRDRQPLAFMCTEGDYNKCHRSRVADALRKMGLMGFEVG